MGLCLCSQLFDDDCELNASQSFARDVSVLKSRIFARKMPVVWLLGEWPVVTSHAANIAEKFGFACVDAARILREEATRDTSRGRMVRRGNAPGKRVPDRLMVDLMKERMINAGDTRGYILAGFPLTPKQAQLFTRELAAVDCVVLLQQLPVASGQQQAGELQHEGDTKALGDKKEKRDKDKDKEEEIAREIVEATGGKWDLLLEKINANEPPADVFLKVEAAILDRTSTNKISSHL